MHIHHAYMGLFLMIWSIAAIFFRAFLIGEYNPLLAGGGLLVGTALFAHDLWWHSTHRKKR
ncbi:MAG: hypothetical protein AB1476_00805 [Candidatus Hadarchaeota archaeon]